MRYSILAWMCGVFIITGTSRAQDATQPVTFFPQGTFSLTLEADYAHNFNISPARIESGTVGVGYYFQDNLSINVEFAGLSVQQPGPDSVISEVDLRIRHHLFNSGRFSFFVDVAGGVSYATMRTPEGGLHFNFTIQSGPGIAYRLSDNLYLMGGVRYWHLSNARIEGPLRNPSINAWEGYVGMMMTF